MQNKATASFSTEPSLQIVIVIVMVMVIVIVILKDNVYGAVIVAVHCHCQSSPGSSDECSTQRQVAADLWTKPISLSQIDPPIGSYSDYIHHRHLSLLSPKADSHFTIPLRVGG